jgi:hypothetical protein
MAQNRIQFQEGLSLPVFLKRYGSEEQCVEALEQWRWPQGFVCPGLWSRRRARAAAHASAVAVPPLPSPNVGDGRGDLRGHQAGADDVVPGDVPADAAEERGLGAGAQTSSGRLLSDRLADQAQSAAGDEGT